MDCCSRSEFGLSLKSRSEVGTRSDGHSFKPSVGHSFNVSLFTGHSVAHRNHLIEFEHRKVEGVCGSTSILVCIDGIWKRLPTEIGTWKFEFEHIKVEGVCGSTFSPLRLCGQDKYSSGQALIAKISYFKLNIYFFLFKYKRGPRGSTGR